MKGYIAEGSRSFASHGNGLSCGTKFGLRLGLQWVRRSRLPLLHYCCGAGDTEDHPPVTLASSGGIPNRMKSCSATALKTGAATLEPQGSTAGSSILTRTIKAGASGGA
jgi:hypothetical protein